EQDRCGDAGPAEPPDCGKNATAALTESKHSTDKSALAGIAAADALCRLGNVRRVGVIRRLAVSALLSAPRLCSCAVAQYRITRDHGGLFEDYKAKYAVIRDRGERVVIDGICNSGCTLVLGIVPLNRVCVTPRASLGFHMAYYDKATTFGVKVMSYEGTAELM